MTAKKSTQKVLPQIRYTLLVVIDVNADDPSEVADLIEQCNQYGSCEIQSVELVSPT